MKIQFKDAPQCPKCRVRIGFLIHFDEDSEIGKCPCCGKTIKRTESIAETILKLVA